MRINLNVKKETFEKYLLTLNFNYKIKEYNKFISRIQKDIFKKMNKTNDLENIISQIFNQDISISFTYSYINISFIDSRYLYELLNNGSLDIYFEEKREVFSNEIMKSAYKIKFLRENGEDSLEYFFKHNKLNDLKGNNNIKRIKSLRCLEQNEIILTENEINKCKKEVLEMILVVRYIGTEIFDFKNYITIISSYPNAFYSNMADLLVEKDILLIDFNFNFKFNRNKKIESIFEVFDSYFCSSRDDIVKYIVKNKDRVDYRILREYMGGSFSKKEEERLIKCISKTMELEESDFLNASLSVSKDVNITVREILSV